MPIDFCKIWVGRAYPDTAILATSRATSSQKRNINLSCLRRCPTLS